MTFSGCGIAGALVLDQADGPVPGERDVREITAALAHRGPDGQATWTAPGVALGHTRLAIMGPGDAGNQPMTRDSLTITYNGEAYNHQDLRRELERDYAFTSGTDTEVVLRAWDKWGPAALGRLDGMFALAIWDARDRTLTLARDRAGIKPLYLYHGSGYILLASEVGAMLSCPLVPRDPDRAAIARHLLLSSALQPDPGATFIAGIRALAPATALTFHADGRQTERTWWTLPATPPGPGPAQAEAAATLSDLIHKVTSAMLTADVPVGVLLSGGLDSASIAATAARRCGAPGTPVTAITTAYSDTATARDISAAAASTDLRHARILAAAHPDAIRHVVITRSSAITLDDIDQATDLAAGCQDPRHPAILGNYRAARQLGLRAVLNGQGADETMAGYAGRPDYIAALPGPGRDLDTSALAAARQAPLLSADVLARRADAHRELRDLCGCLPGPPLERFHRLLLHAQVTCVTRFEDYLAMRSGVEARFPYLDHRIIEWAFSVPFATHLRSARNGKAVLREAMRPWLPPTLASRPKQPFPHPNRGPLGESLAALATAAWPEIRTDPLLPTLFTIPPEQELACLAPQALWNLLATWRWHRKLQAVPRVTRTRR
jgi:asparagine synthase (glutamine-hydrolysing)